MAVSHKTAESWDGINGCKLALFLHCSIDHLNNRITRIKIRDVPSPIMWCTKNVRLSRKLGYGCHVNKAPWRLFNGKDGPCGVGKRSGWVGVPFRQSGSELSRELVAGKGNINSWQDQMSTIWKYFKVGHEGSTTATCNICKILRQL